MKSKTNPAMGGGASTSKKLMAAIAVLAVAFAVFAAIPAVADESDAATSGFTEISGSDFLSLADEGRITLDKNYELTGTVVLTSSLDLDLNGFKMKSNGYGFYSETKDVRLQINGEKSGSAIDVKNSVVFLNAEGNILQVDGGSYSGDYVFIVYNGNKLTGGTATSVKNVTIDATVAGVWMSGGKALTGLIEKVAITSEDIGIYAGTFDDAEGKGLVIKDTTIKSKGTGVEIKSGSVSIEGCTINSSSYSVSDIIGNSASGSGEASVLINNGYSNHATGKTVKVAITNSTIANSVSNTPILVVAGLLENQTVASTGNITLTTDKIGVDQISVIKHVSSSATIEINANTSSQGTDAFVTDETKAEEKLKDKTTYNISLLVTTDISDMDLTVPSSKTLVVSSHNNTITGTIKTGDGNATQSITLNGVKGQFTIEKGSVIVKDGTISTGTITVNEGDTLVLKDVTIAGHVIINGAGSVVVKPGQKVTIKNGVTLTIGADMEVYGSVEKESATGTGKLKIDGQVKLMSGGSVTADVDTSDATGGDDLSYDESLMSDMTVSGVTDVGNTVFSSKNIVTVNGSWTLVAGSHVTVKGKLVVPEGATLKIEAGATLEIMNSAVFQIDGNLEIDEADTTASQPAGSLTITKGEAIVNGNVSISGDIVANDKVTVAQDGVLTIAATGNMKGDGFSVEASGTLEIKGTYGKVVSGATTSYDNVSVKNAGSVVIDSSVPAGSMLTISNVLAGASVDVKKYTMTANVTGGGIEVTDADLVLTTFRDTEAKVDVDVVLSGQSNVITVKPGYSIDGDKSKVDASVSGITIVSDTSTAKTNNGDNAVAGIYKGKQYSKTMDISGTVSAAYAVKENQTLSTTTNANATAAVGITATGANVGFAVTGELSLGDNVTLTNSAGTLAVTGTVKATEKATFTNSDTVKVTKEGEVALVTKTLAGNVTATMYVTKVKDSTGKETSTNHYVDINKALAAASAEGSEIKTLTMLAGQKVNADATLKDGVTLDIGAKTLSIDKADAEITLTIAKGATVKGSGTIDVKDTLFAEDKTNVKVINIKSDVKTEEIGEDGKATKNGWAKWTNLTVALADAPEGSVITVTGEKVTLESNTTVKAGVTLVIPATSIMVLNSGVTLTVDGILKTDGQIYAKGGFDLIAQKVTTGTKAYSSTVIVNGKLMSGIETVYGNGEFKNTEGTAISEYDALFKNGNGAPIAGAYYTEGAYYVIAGLETALKDVSVIESDIQIHGKVVAGDISVKGTENLTKIVVKADDTTTKSSGTVKVIGTALTVKSVALDGVALVIENDATAANSGYFTGSAVIGDASVAANHATGFEFSAKDSKAFVKGAVKIDSDKTDAFGIVAGTVYTDASFAVDVKTEGTAPSVKCLNAMTVAAGATFAAERDSTIAALVVDGTLSVPANKSMTVTELTVNGTVKVDAATSTSASGTLNVTNLYIGITEKDTTGAAAAFSGPVTITAADAKVLISSDATVDDAFVASLDGLKSTKVNVNGSVWFTAYGKGVATFDLKIVPVQNVELNGWAKTEGGEVLKNDDTNSTVRYTFGFTGNAYFENLYALIDTQVYKIVIKADEGIADVYLNGQAMAYGLVKNDDGGFYYAYSSTVAAGDYKVTYTLKNGWSGEAKLAGDNVSGMSFKVSGDYSKENVYQLTGVEKSGYVEPVTPSEDKGDDGLTVTDYLLIVLVVLIVILAVIVAMRLMRS